MHNATLDTEATITNFMRNLTITEARKRNLINDLDTDWLENQLAEQTPLLIDLYGEEELVAVATFDRSDVLLGPLIERVNSVMDVLTSIARGMAQLALRI